MITVVEAGWNSTIQDIAGRPGHAHLGVTEAGAIDPALAAAMNRIVGNPEGSALFETTGDLMIEAKRRTVVASSPAPMPTVLRAGERYHVPIDVRAWNYLAVRGGLNVAPTMGSCSRDTLAGLGPAPIRSGDQFAVAAEPTEHPTIDVGPVRPPTNVIRIQPGPRSNWFDDGWSAVMAAGTWTVSDNSRVGVRLTGPRLARVVERELPSEGLVRGAVQVPPSGELVIMAADHPTTGGYPVIGVVHPDDLAASCQHRPGAVVRLRPVSC